MKTFFKIIGGIFAFIFCICILFVELVTHSIFAINTTFSERKINKIIDSVNMNYLLEDEDGIKTPIYKNIIDKTNTTNLTEDEIEKIIASQGFKNIMKKIINTNAKNILHGEQVVITDEEIDTLVNDNIDNMISSINKKIDLSSRDLLKEVIKNEVKNVVDSIPDAEKINESYPQIVELKTIFRLSTKIELILTIIVLTILISLFTWSSSNGLKYSGITTMIASFIVILFGLFVAFVFSYVLNTMPDFTNYVSFFKPILKKIGMIFVFGGLTSFGISIIMLIFGNLLAIKAEKKKEQGTILAN